MKVHNLMEEFVMEQVDDMYNRLKEQKAVWLTCDCENCRIDTLSYVLNRVPPKYIVSGRGVTHTSSELNTTQIKADVDKLVLDGIRLVSSAKRPTHTFSMETSKAFARIPYFYFPIFTGTIFDGLTFEPLSSAEILLKINGKVAEMIDKTWSNPCKTFKATDGAYSFFVSPVQAQEEKIDGHFDFELDITAPDYESTVYAFSVPVVSQILEAQRAAPNYSLKIQDLFLFPIGSENPMERYIDDSDVM